MSEESGEPSVGLGVEATMLLCDAAQSVGGKLYILGGGWSQVTAVPGGATSMSLAVRLSIPWDLANHRLPVQARLLTEDGELADAGVGSIVSEGELEVARPVGARHGTPLDATFVLNFGALVLQIGGYVWELRVGGEVKARIPFQVRGQQLQ